MSWKEKEVADISLLKMKVICYCDFVSVDKLFSHHYLIHSNKKCFLLG